MVVWSFFVVCVSGYYGKNCSNQCSINCDMASSCDKLTGECDRGCKPGWSGIHCDQGKCNLLWNNACLRV